MNTSNPYNTTINRRNYANYTYPIPQNDNVMTKVHPPPYPTVYSDGFSSNPIFNESLGYHHPLSPEPPPEPLMSSAYPQAHTTSEPSNSGVGKKYYEEVPMHHLLYPQNNHVKFEDDTSRNNNGYIVDEPSLSEMNKLKEGNQTPDDDRKIFKDDSKRVKFNDGRKRIDYILAFDPIDTDDTKRMIRQAKRETYESNLMKIGLELESEGLETAADGKTCFTKVHIPWHLMCKGAEELKIKMPIKQNYRQETINLTETVYERCTRSWMELGVRRKTIAHNTDGIRIVQENDTAGIDLVEILTEKMCCGNPFWKNEDGIPEEMNTYTAAFRRDRIEKFIIPTNEEEFFSHAQRSRVVHRILMRCRYDKKQQQMGINRLIANGTYSSAYPLHEGPHDSSYDLSTHKLNNDRQILYYHWARPGQWYKEQPLDLIRKYFGEKIGLYFTWLGFYTSMLIPAAIMGVLVILYGLCTMNSYEPIADLCDRDINIPMCPKCDNKCDYTSLSDSCLYTKVTYVIDNPFTVVFAIFMSFWATFFLEFWKRKEAEVKYDWDLMAFEDEEEQPRPEFEAAVTTLRLNPVTRLEEPYIPNKSVCPRYTLAINLVVLMIVMVILAILSVVVYRIAVYTVIAAYGKFDIGWVGLIASSTAALINLIVIMLLNKLYEKLAYVLTEWEMPKTQSMFDDLFTFKMYLFQFVNFYGSLFYIAFFKLDPGTPMKYNRIFGFRREECNPAGCMFELGLQLFVIMVGKQVFNNFIELVLPKITKWWRVRDNVMEDHTEWSQWEQDHDLVERNQQGLFYEYLEMVVQYGFITIFVAAFPFGPLFALLNNLTEIRVDAYKLTVINRRPLAERAGDIGIWFEILSGVAKISVVVNAFVIAFVSEMIPRLYYEIMVSPDNNLVGFLNSTLSCFDIKDFQNDTRPDAPFTLGNSSCGFGKQTCRYRGYYHPPYKRYNGTLIPHEDAYEFAPQHWHLIAAKLLFVVVFEHFIFAITNILAWIIPDIPAKLATQIKRENYLAKQAMHDEQTDTMSSVGLNETFIDNADFVIG